MERLRIVGEIVVDNASDVLAGLLETIKRDPELREVDAIEIDCSPIWFIDSSDWRCSSSYGSDGKELVLIGLPENSRRPFAITRLENLFELRDSGQ